MALCPLLARLHVSSLPDFFLFSVILRNIDDAGTYAPAVLAYAFIISTFVGQCILFILNRKMVFHANNNVLWSTLLTVFMALFTVIANGFIGPWVVTLVSGLSFLPEFFVQLLSKLLAMLIPALWIYPMNRFVIHRVKKSSQEETQ